MKRPYLTTMMLLWLPFLCCDAVLAQGDGDYNGDGYVDLDDFAYWEGCMAGPGAGLPDPNCAAFDFDSGRAFEDGGDVDIVDLGRFLAAFTGPNPCTFGRKYALAAFVADATGCSAKIRTRSTTLCGEPSEVRPAASAAWVGVVEYQGGSPVKFLQTGYVRYRSKTEPYSDTISYKKYAEALVGTQGADYIYHIASPPSSGTHEYSCWLQNQLLDVAKYDYDGLPWFQWQHSALTGLRFTSYQYAGEIWNKEDWMVGTPNNKCNYTECKFSLNWAPFQSANITTNDLITSDPLEWGVERVSSTAFNVWDKIQ